MVIMKRKAEKEGTEPRKRIIIKLTKEEPKKTEEERKKEHKKEPEAEENEEKEKETEEETEDEVHHPVLYLLGLEGKQVEELRGGEGTKGGGLYFGFSCNLAQRLRRHNGEGGGAEATKAERKQGETWEVLGVVTGFGPQHRGGKGRGKSLEDMVKRGGGQGWGGRVKFEGGWAAHRQRILEMVKQVKTGKGPSKWQGRVGSIGTVAKVWGKELKVWWWGGLEPRAKDGVTEKWGEAEGKGRWTETLWEDVLATERLGLSSGSASSTQR